MPSSRKRTFPSSIFSLRKVLFFIGLIPIDFGFKAKHRGKTLALSPELWYAIVALLTVNNGT